MQAQAEQRLIEIVTPLISPLGYEVVHIEVQTHRQKTLRLFIDFAEIPRPDEKGETPAIGIEDCVKVAKTLDEPLDQNAEMNAMFHGAYELEVSSPGVDRPLRQKKDYERFSGRQVRLHTFRALSAEEMGNAAHFEKNPKQKNFIGVLCGLKGESIRLTVNDSSADGRPGGKKNKAGGPTGKKKKNENLTQKKSENEITIPLTLISKANLEPIFEFDGPLEE
jgi:ribosome maturation factor RimP